MLPIKDRLYLIEDDFVNALSLGEEALVAFEERWEALLQDVDRIADSVTGLNVECATLVHATATRLATLAETSAELFAQCDDSTSQLVDELNGLLSEMTLQERRPPSPVSSSHPIDIPSPSELHGRKRRRNSDDRVDSPQRNAKRARVPSPSLAHAHTSRSTPIPRQHCPDGSEPCPRPTKRKRCLSDVGTQPLAGCKRSYAGPRLHAVSDTFLPLHRPTLKLATSSSHSDDFFDACGDTWPAMDTLSAAVAFDIQPMVGDSDQWLSSDSIHHVLDTLDLSLVDQPFSKLDECNTLSSSLSGSNESLIPPSSDGDVLAALPGWPLTLPCLSPNVTPSTPSSSSTPSPLSTPSFSASSISVANFDLVPFLPLNPSITDEIFDIGPLQYPSALFGNPKGATSPLGCGDVPDSLLPPFKPMGRISAGTSSWTTNPTSILVDFFGVVEGDRT